MATPQKRSGIPVSTTPNKSRFLRMFSKSNDSNLNNSPETDLDVFTLLEENIALKEAKEQLLKKTCDAFEKSRELEFENNRLTKQLEESKNQVRIFKQKQQEVMDKYDKEYQELRTHKNIHDQQKKIIDELLIKLNLQEKQQEQLIEASKQAKLGLEEIVRTKSNLTEDYDHIKNDNFATETIEQLVIDIGNIRTHLNGTELQLYEANEKIAELIENQHNLEEENKILKTENLNLTKVAKLITESIKESVDTSKIMEDALLKVRKRNDELVKESNDALDSPSSPKFLPVNERVSQLKEELIKKDAAHNERIVEMTKLMETTIETNYNVDIHVLQLRLDMAESKLQIAIDRAEKAEAELKAIKKLSANKFSCVDGEYFIQKKFATLSPLPTSQLSQTPLPPPPPPPPPPPMPTFNLPPINNFKSGTSLNDGIAALTLKRWESHNPSNQQVKATGMDALIAQLKDGSVTLRKRKHQQKKNPALQEMFEILDIARAQNRNSKIIVSQFSLSDMPGDNL